MSNRIAWIDVETDSLDAETGHLLEIACLVTDGDLNVLDEEGFHAVVKYTSNEAHAMRVAAKPVVREMHDKTGLWVRTWMPEAVPLDEVDLRLSHYLSDFGAMYEMPVAGNSVRLDMNFMDKHLPRVSNYLDYHMRDVSTLAGFANDWYGHGWDEFEKHNDHTAMTDIRESIREARYYRERFWKPLTEHDPVTLLRRRAMKEAPNAKAALEFMADVIESGRVLPKHMLGDL